MNDFELPLDMALARSLTPPPLPAGFRTRLLATIAREGEYRVPLNRMALAADYDRQMRELKRGYLRLQWRTLLTLLTAAFTVGVLARAVAPELHARFGDLGLLGLAMAGAVAGSLTAATYWWRGEQL